jgi:hypothetical protein
MDDALNWSLAPPCGAFLFNGPPALVRCAVVGFPDGSQAADNRRMAPGASTIPIEPMTLGNMRANGVRSLDVSCWQCYHRAILSADRGPTTCRCRRSGRMVCTRRGIIGADARPNWRAEQVEHPHRGVQFGTDTVRRDATYAGPVEASGVPCHARLSNL